VTGDAAKRNLRVFGSPFGAVYSAYMEHEGLSRVIARVLWSSDARPYYASMEAIAAVPAGGTVVDAPCGAGVAFRGIVTGQRIRYLGFDLSPRMLERARRVAARRGLDQVELAVADVTELPLEDGSAELFLSYFGLHCLDEPEAALREAARILRPGGRLVGTSIVRGTRRLDRLRVQPGRGGFGRVGTEAELSDWIRGAGFHSLELETSGIFSVFTAAARRQPIS
jgi:SAM-dependent methyltransferase